MNLSKYEIGASVTVSNIEKHLPRTASMVQAELNDLIKDVIIRVKTEEITKDFSTTYVARVYCFTPDELHKIIQEEAMKLNRRMQCK